MKVDDQVIKVLCSAAMVGSKLTLTGQLDRNLYTRTNKVLEAAGGKWHSKQKTHLFPGAAADAIENIILSGEVTVPQDFGYFPTPPELARRLVAFGNVHPRMTVLEPSAGRGSIVAELHAAGATVEAVEQLPANVDALKAQGLAAPVVMADFLTLQPRREFDRVVMNPPFAKQADIHHVLHALRFLKPYGGLVSVMSASVEFRDNALTKGFRGMVERRGGWFEPVEDGAFKSSGTLVRTVLAHIPAGR